MSITAGTRFVLTAIALTLAGCGAVLALEVQLTLQVADGGPGAFKGISAPDSFRRYAAEPILLRLTGHEVLGTAPSLSSQVLVSELEPCLVVGTIPATQVPSEPLDCVANVSLSWSTTPAPHFGTDYLFSAESVAIGPATPAGVYTLFFVLRDAQLEDLLGERAVKELRTNPVHLVVGPPTDQDELLSHWLREGETAASGGSWTIASQRAQSILALYPDSVLASCLLGRASEALGDPEAATSAYLTALDALEAGRDTRTPRFRLESHREAQLDLIRGSLWDLGVDVYPEEP